MAEWFKAAVLKTAFRFPGTGVRIPLPPFYPYQYHLFAMMHSNRSDCELEEVPEKLRVFVDRAR